MAAQVVICESGKLKCSKVFQSLLLFSVIIFIFFLYSQLSSLSSLLHPMPTPVSTPTSSTNCPHYVCSKCQQWFKNKSGLTQHTNTFHLALACPLLASPQEPQDQDFDSNDPPLPLSHPDSLAACSSLVQDEHNVFVDPNETTKLTQELAVARSKREPLSVALNGKLRSKE